MRCHQCGQEVESNNRFCNFCGTEQFAGASDQFSAFDHDNSQNLNDNHDGLFMDEDALYEDDEYYESDMTYYSYHEKRPIRWWPIALALFSILLLVGVIIGIWLQFFSDNNKKVQFSDPSTAYKLDNTRTTEATSSQLSDRATTSTNVETTTSTSATAATTVASEETSLHTTTMRSIDIIVVTISETTPPTTPPTTTTTTPRITTTAIPPTTTTTAPPTTALSTTSVSASTVEPVTSYVASIPVEESTASSSPFYPETTTPKTSMPETSTSSVSEEITSTTTPTYPLGFLSIDNVHMDMWPSVRLHYTYQAPQPTPVTEPDDSTEETNSAISPTTTPPSKSTTSTSEQGETDPVGEDDRPVPFDIRFLSIWESETLDGEWIEQTVEEQKSTSKLLVVTDTSKKLIDLVGIETLRYSINHLVESMDFPEASSERMGDALGLMQFSDVSMLLTQVTHEQEELIDATDKLTKGADGSLLWNSLYLALSETPDKGAILLVTRGEDTGSIITPLYVRTMAQMKGIPIYTIFIKTEESEPTGEREEYFKTFSEITGGRCYVIDATNPDLDISAGVSMGLVTAYEGDHQNKYLTYNSTTRIDFPTRYVKLVYAQEGLEPIESEIVSYVIPEDAAYSESNHSIDWMSIFLLHSHVLGERIE